MLSKKLLWGGLTIILALALAVSVFNVRVDEAIIKFGAIAMVLGAILLVFDK